MRTAPLSHTKQDTIPTDQGTSGSGQRRVTGHKMARGVSRDKKRARMTLGSTFLTSQPRLRTPLLCGAEGRAHSLVVFAANNLPPPNFNYSLYFREGFKKKNWKKYGLLPNHPRTPPNRTVIFPDKKLTHIFFRNKTPIG